jgi:hypothetical protein
MSNDKPKPPQVRPDASKPVQPVRNLFAPSGLMPEAIELDSDSAWQQFQALASRGDAGFAATEPATLVNGAKPASAPPPAAATLDQVMVEARRLNRVCPKPLQWVRLYALLPDCQPGSPSPPLHGRTLNETSSLGKRMVLREQIEWAAARGGLDTVMAYLSGLSEQDWHHMDE